MKNLKEIMGIALILIIVGLVTSSCALMQQPQVYYPQQQTVAVAGNAAAQNAAIDAIRAQQAIIATQNRNLVHQYQTQSAILNSNSNAAVNRIKLRRAGLR